MFVLPDSINYNPHLSSTEISILRCLRDHCGRTNTCYPGEQRIAAYCRCSIRTIQRYLPRLEELQFVEVIQRPGKSNYYRVLCLERVGPANTHDTKVSSEQTSSSTKQRLGTAVDNFPKKSWKEISLLVQDICEVMGENLSQKNLGWFITVAKKCSWELIQDCLRYVKEAVLEGQLAGQYVERPSALFTWKLRSAGAYI